MRNFVRKAAAAACVLSTAVMCTMTSALAEVQYADGKVTIPVKDTESIITDDRIEAKTQMTTMIVSAEKWDNITKEELTADDIYYINQDEAGALQTLLAGGDGTAVGVKGGSLPDGTYVALIGGEDVEAAEIMAIKFSVTSGSEEEITSIQVEAIDNMAPGDVISLKVLSNLGTDVTADCKFEIVENEGDTITLEGNKVTANDPGDATIKVTLNDNPGITTEVTVVVEYIDEQVKVAVEPKSATLVLGDENQNTVQLTANVTGTEIQGVKWTSSDDEIATVDQEGKVTAVAKGSVTITATSLDPEAPDAKGTATIVVTDGSGEEYDPENYGKTWAYLGDVDMDQQVSMMDAAEIQYHMLKIDGHIIVEDTLKAKVADTDNDTQISMMDAAEIQYHMLKIPGHDLTDKKVKAD